MRHHLVLGAVQRGSLIGTTNWQDAVDRRPLRRRTLHTEGVSERSTRRYLFWAVGLAKSKKLSDGQDFLFLIRL